MVSAHLLITLNTSVRQNIAQILYCNTAPLRFRAELTPNIRIANTHRNRIKQVSSERECSETPYASVQMNSANFPQGRITSQVSKVDSLSFHSILTVQVGMNTTYVQTSFTTCKMNQKYFPVTQNRNQVSEMNSLSFDLILTVQVEIDTSLTKSHVATYCNEQKKVFTQR